MIRMGQLRFASGGRGLRAALCAWAAVGGATALAGCAGEEFAPPASNVASNTGGEAGVGGAGAAGGSSPEGGAGGGSGGEGGAPVVTPPGCVPADNGDQPLPADCGVFVNAASGSDANDGSSSSPVKSLSQALAIANAKPIYACVSTTPDLVPLEVATHAVFYGGLDCDDWTYLGESARTAVEGALGSTEPPVRVEGPVEVVFDGFRVTAPGALDASEHSIAMWVDGGFVELHNVDLVAGDASSGADGAAPAVWSLAAPNGLNATGKTGGAQLPNGACPLSGGKGGNGGSQSGGFAVLPADGLPGDNGNGAEGGLGEKPTVVNWSCLSGDGAEGDPGTNGAPGAGGTGLVLTSSGLGATAGANGTNGLPGQSGGGAGGTKVFNGADGKGGGGGGPGGCGGQAGKGGAPGGSSVALVALNAEITVDEVLLRTGNAGGGGDGGDGQWGQQPGDGGFGAPGGGCRGGAGGWGGHGGNGGGGSGGNSIGILSKGSVVAGQPIFDSASGEAGQGGVGATMATVPDGGDGVDGVRAITFEL